VSAGQTTIGALTSAQRRSVLVGLVVGIPLSALFLVLALRNVDAIGGVYVLQATRWRTIANVPSVSRPRFVAMVVSGVACNNVLPGRLGDIFRARWLSIAGRIPGGRSFATVVLDRVADVATLVLFLLLSLWFVTNAAWLRWLVGGGLALLALTGALLALARSYTTRRARERRDRRGLVRRLARDTAEGLAEPLGRASPRGAPGRWQRPSSPERSGSSSPRRTRSSRPRCSTSASRSRPRRASSAHTSGSPSRRSACST
jgi:hypothetical protein